MSSTVINNVTLVLSDSLKSGMALKMEIGKITDIGPIGTLSADTVIDGEGKYLAPGFIDIHVHGGGGHDFMDATVEATVGAMRAHMQHGTTTMVPTSLTSEDFELEALFNSIRTVKASLEYENLPFVPGVHLEGPYVAPVMAGAQDPKYIKSPTPEDWRKIVKLADGEILIWTVAPELDGAIEMARELRKEGILFSAGHSEAKYSDAVAAIEAGYTMATHLYSSMSTIIRENGYRVPGLLEAALLHDEYAVEVIADGKHLPISLLQLIRKTKGLERIVLVTDAMRGAGMPDGEYLLGSLTKGQLVSVFDGIAHMPDGISFAGSVATTDRLVRVMTKQAGLPLWEAVKMMTANPAREIGIDHCKGSLDIGMDADLVLFDDDINVKSVFIGGKKTV
ncbi:MAG: N-acetylglucosamine-6-phosphate deacetylase [Clostridia bacterium]|nr:N-acetylglucosamine-6-phosphate deacetylase [Clostridia bacterium]